MTDTRTKPGKFTLIEAGRGIAALLVVLHHAGSIMAEPRFFGGEPFGGHLRNFNVGVDFFFVLSGFIITWVHARDFGQPRRLGNYASKRFLRVFPPYWALLIPLILLYQLFPNAGVERQRDPVNIVLSIFLLPYTSQPVLGVAWTLTHEMLFYALFAALIAWGGRWLWLYAIWGVAIVAVALAGIALPYPASFLLSPFNLEFIMGVAAALMLRRWAIPAPRLVMIAGAAIFLAGVLFALHVQDVPLYGRLFFGLSSLLFVLGAVETERTHGVRLPAWLGALGAASYVIYLTHSVAISFACTALAKLGGRALPLEVACLLLAAIGLAAGFAYHWTVEAWTVGAARRLLQGARTRKEQVEVPAQ